MVDLYTLELGKVRTIAKGVRKAHSRKAGHLEPFTRVSLLLARGRDLLIITQAETIDAYLPLRDDLMLVGYASYVIELLDRFTFPEEENRAIYRLLTNTLPRLTESTDIPLVLRYYELSLLKLTGFRPQLFNCVQCQAEIKPQDQYFSSEQGGALCPNCGPGIARSRPVSMLALKYLRYLQRSTYAEARQVRPAEQVHREMEMLMQDHITYLLERRLNTPAFLRKVKLK
jgi:DNA repair protein RecO (recombination protein O)